MKDSCINDGPQKDECMEKIMLLSHTLTMRGSDVGSLVEFRPVVKEEIVWGTNGLTMDARTEK